MEGPYSARLPSSSIGETSRRAPVDRGAADGRAPRPRARPANAIRSSASRARDPHSTGQGRGTNDRTRARARHPRSTRSSMNRSCSPRSSTRLRPSPPVSWSMPRSAVGATPGRCSRRTHDVDAGRSRSGRRRRSAAAAERLAGFGDRVTLRRASFDQLADELPALGVEHITCCVSSTSV